MSDQDSSLKWIQEMALPLWWQKGMVPRGGFVESLSVEGDPLPIARRAMVQARQLYSFRLAMERNWLSSEINRPLLLHQAEHLIRVYSLPNGAFAQAASVDGKQVDSSVELYTQAFCLFGLAQAHKLEARPLWKERALKLLRYLDSERRLKQGGFTELKQGQVLFEANPHMHLFEATLAWMEVDQDPIWKGWAEEILEICLSKFIDPSSGILAEHFDLHWKPLLENGRFVFEPGHQYEWAWLMGRYQIMTGSELTSVRMNLFETSEKFGICPKRRVVMDELWSDLTPKLKTSRFWTQCERIKCAVQLEKRASAQEAMKVLMLYLQTTVPGLWWDRMDESGKFKNEASKASSLYHILGAIAEYNTESFETSIWASS